MKRVVIIALAFALTGCGILRNRHPNPCARPSLLDGKQKIVCALALDGVLPVQQGDKIRLILSNDKFFQLNSSEFRHDHYGALTQVIELAASYPDRQIQVISYGDNVGAPRAIKSLSQLRADNIAAFMWAQGIKPERIVAVGRGRKAPIATNRSPRGSAHNRRTEIIVNPPFA